ncbi:hypothetical protein AALO_G00096240 [Alosa alosa]|uniref:B30.2/SPRY domain-containing protein n=1 Tax=Alosa alosa TaxID=278164 RepID=A0AAV6GSM8_9TELE|nr:hypothetical protein AALO_G00096240 [Alosa alosa]
MLACSHLTQTPCSLSSLFPRSTEAWRVLRRSTRTPTGPRGSPCAPSCSVPGRCSDAYWEAEWSGSKVLVGVSYERLERKAAADVSGLGANASSWALEWKGISGSYQAWHDERRVDVPPPPRSWSTARRVGVLLDSLTGTLSFYGVSPSSGQLMHLHTFHEAFSEPLYAGFWVAPNCCVSLCQLASSTPSENHEWNP